ncbi:hypothetical protein F4781DRAFT_433026 [Annulohypoxylon bovei var. microspora]|nr:hypothetical protein F4781DRAFT_433026 [Annulohypoxylon bovei var. microspora]
MRISTATRLLLMGLGATQALGRMVPWDKRFEMHPRSAEPDIAPAQNEISPVPEPPPELNETMAFQTFELENSLNVSELPDKGHWIIPVSHAACSHWDVKDINVRGSIQNIVIWSNEGNTVGQKFLHWDVDGMVGAFVCNCKWNYRDSEPSSEMWEFYERLVTWCGQGRSGWMFSKKWEKGWSIATRDYILFKEPKKFLCPTYCCWTP